MQQLVNVYFSSKKNTKIAHNFQSFNMYYIISLVLFQRRRVSFNWASSFLKPYKFGSIRFLKQSALAAHSSLTGGCEREMRVSSTNVRGLSCHPSTARGWIGETRNQINRVVHRGRERCSLRISL